MRVFMNGSVITLKDADLLGEGGEAKVYRYRNSALKIFHDVASGSLEAKIRDQKLKKLEQFPPVGTDRVIAPQALVKNAKGATVGYAMAVVQGDDVAALANPKRRALKVHNAQVAALFADLHATVAQLHQSQWVVGDLNDGNVLVNGERALIIDADSMQFGTLACMVGHERFLDPRLYGVDLTRGLHFSAQTDWYAFAVMYFASLLCVHPFGGTHPKHKTMLRRAEARHSILKGDVTLPRTARLPGALSDEALHWFSAVFDGDVRTAPPASVLQARWSVCSCGAEHSRAVCPSCHQLGPVAARTVVRTRGRCTARTVFRTDGRILCTTIQGGLKYAYEESGQLKREDGQVVQPSMRDTVRVGINGSATWCAERSGRVRQYLGTRESGQCQTTIRQGEPVLAVSSRGALVQQQEWLVNASNLTRVGLSLENQTWLWAADDRALGFYRAGMFVHVFIHEFGTSGLKKVKDIHFTGKLLEADAVFDDGMILLSVTTAHSGKETVQRWLIDGSAKVIAASADGPRGHAAMLHGRVVLATDAGLVLLKNESGHLIEHLHFTDTQEFVAAGDELLSHSDGSLYVIGAREITQLTLM